MTAVPAIQRYKMTIAYDGTAYYGWQRQAISDTWKGPGVINGTLPTVQGEIEKALREVVQHPVGICGSSRTDGGVHAKAQVAHFDTHMTQIPMEGLRRGINSRLPDDIVIKKIEAVGPEFNAIGCAVRKRYQYAIWNHPDRNPFAHRFTFHRFFSLDVNLMKQGAQRLVGLHDFTSFARPGHLRTTTVRRVLECSVSQRGPLLVIGVTGTGFLWNMVRIIAGTLVETGMGRRTPESLSDALLAKDRNAAGPTAPPEGLYLQWIAFAATEKLALAEKADNSDQSDQADQTADPE